MVSRHNIEPAMKGGPPAAVRLGMAALALAGLAVLAPRSAGAQADVHVLTLSEAITRALEKNERIIVEREAVAAADAAVVAAKGAYDPMLGVRADWQRATPPVNSAFSGAPAGGLAPTVEAGSAGVTLGAAPRAPAASCRCVPRRRARPPTAASACCRRRTGRSSASSCSSRCCAGAR